MLIVIVLMHVAGVALCVLAGWLTDKVLRPPVEITGARRPPRSYAESSR